MTTPCQTCSMNDEPGIGTVVRDVNGRCWIRTPTISDWVRTYWVPYPDIDGDPASWTKLSGNWGPVEIMSDEEVDRVWKAANK